MKCLLLQCQYVTIFTFICCFRVHCTYQSIFQNTRLLLQGFNARKGDWDSEVIYCSAICSSGTCKCYLLDEVSLVKVLYILLPLFSLRLIDALIIFKKISLILSFWNQFCYMLIASLYQYLSAGCQDLYEQLVPISKWVNVLVLTSISEENMAFGALFWHFLFDCSSSSLV